MHPLNAQSMHTCPQLLATRIPGIFNIKGSLTTYAFSEAINITTRTKGKRSKGKQYEMLLPALLFLLLLLLPALLYYYVNS